MASKIYVASSWRNRYYPMVVSMLRVWGHEVYDFRDDGFSWKEIWSDYNDTPIPAEFIIEGLETTEEAKRGFNRDKNALDWADTCILLMPCGNSAHAEFGYAVGKEKSTCVLLPYDEPIKPDLMWKFADLITHETEVLKSWLAIS